MIEAAIIVIIMMYTSRWSVYYRRDGSIGWFGLNKSEINGSCTVNPAAFSHGFARSRIRSTYHPMMLLASRPNDRADRRLLALSLPWEILPIRRTRPANNFTVRNARTDLESWLSESEYNLRWDDLFLRRKNSSSFLTETENRWCFPDHLPSDRSYLSICLSARFPCRARKASRRQSTVALKGTATDRSGGSDDFKCGLKDIFREALYIYTRVYASMRTRECRAIYASATVSAFQTFFVARPAAYARPLPHAALWNSAYGMRAPATRRAASSSTADRQHWRIYVAPKLRRPLWISSVVDRDITQEACRLPELSRLFAIRDIRAERILRELCRRESIPSSFPQCEFFSRTISESEKRNAA